MRAQCCTKVFKFKLSHSVAEVRIIILLIGHKKTGAKFFSIWSGTFWTLQNMASNEKNIKIFKEKLPVTNNQSLSWNVETAF